MIEKRNFAWPSTSINRADYTAFRKWFDTNEERIRKTQLIIWGAGIRGTIFSIFLKKCDFFNIVFVDSNTEKWGGYIDEFIIWSPEQLEWERENQERIILISTENSEEIEKELEGKRYRRDMDFFTIKSSLYDKYLEEFNRNYNNQFLVMGDCEFSTISIRDTDYRTLEELLNEKIGKENLKILAMHGMGIRAYYNIFCAQIAMGMKPSHLLLMVNFDTLTGKQHLLPRSQHAELIQKIYDGLVEKNEEFTTYTKLVWERSHSIQAEFFTKSEEKNDNVTDAKARNYFRLNYMYRLNVETEGMVYLSKILDKASQEGIKVTPFIPPVNYQLGENLLGESFRERYEQNVERVKGLVYEKNVDLLDLSYVLSENMFAEKRTPDETANYLGRVIIANLMEEALLG